MKWNDDKQPRSEAGPEEPLPTQEQIRARAAAIRRGWNEKTRRRRRVQPQLPPYQVPLIHLSEIPFPNENN